MAAVLMALPFVVGGLALLWPAVFLQFARESSVFTLAGLVVVGLVALLLLGSIVAAGPNPFQGDHR
ncbi:MAG: hypothetical protein ABIQ26_06440 [Streptosporangiaceae bacterium]